MARRHGHGRAYRRRFGTVRDVRAAADEAYGDEGGVVRGASELVSYAGGAGRSSFLMVA